MLLLLWRRERWERRVMHQELADETADVVTRNEIRELRGNR
jgi:hypothetical protein